jgi:hypothetical protein
LDLELAMVSPRIIVALGVPATRWFLGSDTDTMEHMHGRPIEKDGRIILPCYHPAAGLHDTGALRFVYDDFQVLHGLVNGASVEDYELRDEYPNPDYRVVDTKRELDKAVTAISLSPQVAVDVETIKQDTELWSVQTSIAPGTGVFIPMKLGYSGRLDTRPWGAQVIVHFYLNDVNWLDIPEDNFVDTLVMAYLLGLPQGLKTLALTLCGIKMISYREMVRPGQQILSQQYLTEASTREWPDPPLLEETKWDNKIGKVITRTKKPWHISRKVTKMFKDIEKGGDVDLWARWQSIPDAERECVEKVLGAMPESSLANISFEDAVQYATRDADATLRVKLKMEQYGCRLDSPS